MPAYVVEPFTKVEQRLVEKHFSSTTSPVFVLRNMPGTTAAALFARYSRTPKSIRRLFLDEFAKDATFQNEDDGTVGLAQAEALFSRVLSAYGDDSVAQLTTVHVACEQVSQLLAKQLEWGRLGAYLEQSTRYIPYTDKREGRYRYIRDDAVAASPLAHQYEEAMDGLFDTYTTLIPDLIEMLAHALPGDSTDSARTRAIRALALDIMRGLLPAGTVSNVGICSTPQAFEQLLYRLKSNPLPEAQAYAVQLYRELQTTIAPFLTRVDREDRGGVWVDYLTEQRSQAEQLATQLAASRHREPDASPASSRVALLSWTLDGEDAIIASSLFPHMDLPLRTIQDHVARLDAKKKDDMFASLVGERTNRRYRPGRGFEHSWYTFEIVSDYGAFRDLQRHRMLTIQWQDLTPDLGYTVPNEVSALGTSAVSSWVDAVQRAEACYEDLKNAGFPQQAQYCVTLGHRMRYTMECNAREAMHMIELRTSPQGHPSYRAICQDMHRLIRDQAGHRRLAQAMRFVGMEDVHLPRYAEESRQVDIPAE